MIAAAEQLGSEVGVAPACEALFVSRASLYRRRPGSLHKQKAQRAAPRKLTIPEQVEVLKILHDVRFADRAPAEVYATLLDEGRYVCSIRSMYRILHSNREVRERRSQLRHPAYRKPELLATAPNQVWSWDITKLRGPEKWIYYSLYVILDIFSRYVTGWMVASRESRELARRLISQTCEKQQIQRGQLSCHADRGSPMISKTLAQLYADLGIVKSHSRPHVSNDNPFSEAQFKTLKYSPDFPDRFGSQEDAASFCRRFFPWYNRQHRHSGIGMMTPEMVHLGRAATIHIQRRQVLLSAYGVHPERFVRKPPEPPKLPSAVWINPPRKQAEPVVQLP